MIKNIAKQLYAGVLLTLCLLMLYPDALFAAEDSLPGGKEQGQFIEVDTDNPVYNPNQLFRGFENFYSPRIERLKQRYNLEEVVAGESDEWKRILLLRHWIRANIEIENVTPAETRGDPFAILDSALQGGRFHCTHFSRVLHAVLNSFGYVTRRLGCGPGLIDDGGHHGVNEVWVNKLSKWVIVDAKYDSHFEKDGVPLSALEIRDLIWKGEKESIVRIKGPDGEPMKPNPETGAWETRPDTYRWCAWETDTNRFTAFPAPPTSTLVFFDDEIFRANKWYRDGKLHWAYDTPFMLLTPRRDWIEWTPNVISSEVTVNESAARVFLSSCTPNFRSFQLRTPAGTWSDCGEELEILLHKDSPNDYSFRTMNLFGVPGPEHRVAFRWTGEAVN